MTVAQIIVAPKGIDAVALTAEEAIRTLLRYGDFLSSVSRRQVLEVVAESAEPELRERLLAYLGRTFELWNSNKERCWLRTGFGCWEVVPGHPGRSVDSIPGLGGATIDHLLLWTRPDGEGEEWPVPGAELPGDFPSGLEARRGEIYSLQWSRVPDATERRARGEGVAAVRNRGRGLLVHPQYQAYRILESNLDLHLWETP